MMEGEASVVVCVADQTLLLMRGERVDRRYHVSTSRHGVGNIEGSGKTPPGLHRIAERIGAGQPVGMVFRDRIPTGEVALGPVDGVDAITSRILRLEGLEEGVNRGRGIDSFERCIYIHGTTDEGGIGRPTSEGCIRMRNADVIDLFDRVVAGTQVEIVESSSGIEHDTPENHGR